MSKQLTKEELAELIIYADIIDSILMDRDFKQDTKMEFNRIQKSTKQIIKFVFGHTDVGELDEWKYQLRIKLQKPIREFVKSMTKDKVYLND